MIDPSSPYAPKYWQHETSGELARVVRAYLEGHALSLRELGLMRAYVLQWITSPVWDQNPSRTVASFIALGKLRHEASLIASMHDLNAWFEAALAEGIDPL